MEEDYQVYINDVDGLVDTLDDAANHEEQKSVLTPETSKGQSRTREAQEPLISDEQKLRTSLSEPPDINYRSNLFHDAEKIDWICNPSPCTTSYDACRMLPVTRN